MKFASLSSGSSGNCQLIEDGNTKILIDAGISTRKITTELKKLDISPQEIDAIFITHEHTDHIKGLETFVKKYSPKVFANEPTMSRLIRSVKNLRPADLFLFENERPFKFKNLSIHPFSTFHDCACGSAFVVEKKKKISVFTDSGWVNEYALNAMEGSDLYYIEANHEVEMLLNGPYPWHLKQRILSTHGHLSNDNTIEVLDQLLKNRDEKIVLAHLSKENNSEELALKKISENSSKNYLKPGKNLFAADKKELSCVFEIGEL